MTNKKFIDYIRNDGEYFVDFNLVGKQTYNGNPRAKRAYLELEYNENQLKEYIRCRKNVHYFINKYLKTISIDEGVVPFLLYDYQTELIESYHKNRFNISLQARQSGKTTTTAAFILWYSIFHSNKTIAILANKAAQAQDIVSRITTMLEWLPNFLKPGMIALNKRSLEFDNGSEIFSAATSSGSIRGRSVSLLYIDEAAFIPNDVEFYESTYPTITSGKKSRVIMTSTPKGARGLFYKLYMDSVNGNNEYANSKITWDRVPGRDEAWKEETIRNTNDAQFLQEYCCEFMGSQNTLVRSLKLQSLVYQNPEIEYENGLKIYTKPVEGYKYILVADPSEGTGNDNSAFTVIDVTEIPYKNVATYKNNTVSPMMFPTVMYNVAREYNEALILCELNNIGHLVANTLYYDLEYENMVMVGSKKGSQVLFSGTNIRPGVKTTTAVKSVGCSSLKTLIENDKLVINDLDTISELGTFVAKGKSYEADQNCNDDTVATLFLFSWLTNQQYFKDYTDKDIRANIIENNESLLESLTPFGIIDDGLDEDDEFEEVVVVENRWSTGQQDYIDDYSFM